MTKRLSREQKTQQAVKDLINQMCIIAGHQVTYENIAGRTDAWFTDWTMTEAQNEEWKNWGIKYLKTRLKMNTYFAKQEMAMINLMWGLKLSDLGNGGNKQL